MVPTAKLVTAPNPPVPVPNSTETLLVAQFVTARSVLLSELKSPVVTESGLVPAAKLVAVLNESVSVHAPEDELELEDELPEEELEEPDEEAPDEELELLEDEPEELDDEPEELEDELPEEDELLVGGVKVNWPESVVSL